MNDAAAPARAVDRPPLAVDLDGTLVRIDTFHEGLIRIIKEAPFSLFRLARSLPQGRAAFKHAVAAKADLDPTILPYNQELLAYLSQEHEAGRRIGLFTAANQSIADAVAKHLGIFEVAKGSDANHNLSGTAKADAIEATFGPRFVYAGDNAVDVPIFARSAAAIVAGPAVRRLVKTAGVAPVEAVFPVPSPSPADWIQALRSRHWSKNILVFVAPLIAYQYTAIALSALLFVLLGVLSSATHLLHQLVDLFDDRAHPKKCLRPFASGTIPVFQGVAAAATMIFIAMLVGFTLLPPGCWLALAAYLAITLLHGVLLKRIAMIDLVVIAGLFTLRVLAGSLLVDGPVLPWLVPVSMLFFLGVAGIMRYTEPDRR